MRSQKSRKGQKSSCRERKKQSGLEQVCSSLGGGCNGLRKGRMGWGFCGGVFGGGVVGGGAETDQTI